MAETKLFDRHLKRYFNADRGAFSVVTATEAKDGQVTVSSDEKKIVLEHFGDENLEKYVGNDAVLNRKGLDARRSFRLFPTGQIVRPKLKYPKLNNSELRLYFNNDDFKVREGHYWGIFERSGEIWIFQSTDALISRLEKGEFSEKQSGEALETESDDYQSLVNAREPALVESTLKAWKRNPQVAARALKNAGYKCELFPQLPVFVSRYTGNPFVEAHHLIPMKVQEDFSISLDIELNICAVSPFAHRKIHMARFEDIVDDLRRLIVRRKKLLDLVEISEDELLSYYAA